MGGMIKRVSGALIGPSGILTRTANLDPSFFGLAYPWLSRATARDPQNIHAWTFAAMKLRGQAIGSTPLVVKDGKQGKPINPNHPLQKLLDRPNRYYSASVFWRLWQRAVDLTGRCIVVMERTGPMPTALYAMDLDEFQVDVLYDDGRRAPLEAGQWHRVREVLNVWHRAANRKYRPDEVMIFEVPEGPPLRAARLSIDADYGAAEYSKAWVQNDLNPAGWYSVTEFLEDQELKQLKSEIDQKHTGPHNAGKPMILMGGAKWEPNPQTMRDMQWIEGRAHWLEEICAAFGVPKTLLGVTDDLNYATHLGQQRVFWESTVLPLMSDIQDALWTRLLYQIEGGRYWAEFDTSKVPALSSDMTDRVTRAQALFSIGVPLNQINDRLQLGLTRVVGGDVGLVPAGLIPLPDATMPLDIPEAPAEPLPAAPDATANATGPAPAVDAVQDLAMNGAQVSALQAVVQAVADKSLPPEAAKLMILAAFPSLPEIDVIKMVNAAAAFEQAPEPAPNPPSPMGGISAPAESDSAAPVVGKTAPGAEDEEKAGQLQDSSKPSSKTVPSRGGAAETSRRPISPLRRLQRAIACRRVEKRAERERAKKAQQKWAAFYGRVVAPMEARYAKKFHSILFRQKRDVLAQFDAQVKRSKIAVNIRAPEDAIRPSDISLDLSKWQAEMDRLLTPTYETMIKAAVKAGGALPVINVADPRMSAIIDDRVGEKLVDVTRKTTEAVQATLRNGLESGKTLADMRRDLANLPDFSRERARTVAITEMGHTTNNARAAQFDEADIQEVFWLSVGDAAVRSSHRAAEAEGKKRRGQTFSNGLRFPHDPNGSPEEVINCRCGLEAAYD